MNIYVTDTWFYTAVAAKNVQAGTWQGSVAAWVHKFCVPGTWYTAHTYGCCVLPAVPGTIPGTLLQCVDAYSSRHSSTDSYVPKV